MSRAVILCHMNRTFDILLHRDETGTWVVTVPALPGCVSQGRTKAEARTNIREAMGLHLEAFGPDAVGVASDLVLSRVRVPA